jgi:hypothetical protein
MWCAGRRSRDECPTCLTWNRRISLPSIFLLVARVPD